AGRDPDADRDGDRDANVDVDVNGRAPQPASRDPRVNTKKAVRNIMAILPECTGYTSEKSRDGKGFVTADVSRRPRVCPRARGAFA
ncbi:MAG TPA: hypothetical protein PKA58_26815, partial [Polyangium sp.]|nr:hypothetical protein [Polyangium sp.]